ncbi:MAG: biotin-dependent carboxyltransferase family protein [Acidaminococcus fermentans]|uniref:5-oxoprolinase subunit C family protein n=1 Tax=Acidaminococcus fermentans TaxID=905 RepID=UPI00242C9EFD|nr:biotin-dependent carboxyltransferase family protein [Acidaminococcus fermentans]MCI6286873.1 biotin-dependent carboxyltransferase family protein [Acidaminococcus fermentans]MDD7196028.1 biotin-dependent carboxyltransferase family protein [Acidaminococcus fermentans]MDY2852436.1 biotin-dependent carboxyltransferase family protein [Acidaminococcus fermentans]
MKIIVKKGGPLTTLQDTGRYGFQKYGVLVSGAMDLFSLKLGNILVGNKESEGALEMTMSGPFLKLPAGLVFALTGADLGAKMGGKPVPLNRAVYVKEDSALSFGFAAKGVRGYLTVAGGFAVPEVMNSKSTYLRAKIGGVGGAPLADGTELETGDLTAEQEKLAAALAGLGGKPFSTLGWSVGTESLFAGEPIRVTQGLQADWFSNATLHAFFRSGYTITAQSDRMGYRLSGTPLPYKDSSLEMISEPVTFGSIQVPADGNPIILMADRQTTGGYAKIGQVIQADLSRLAQMKPGQTIYFQPVTLTQAEEALARQADFLTDAAKMVKR